MKRFIRIAALIMAFSMLFSVCSCTEKSHSGSGRTGREYVEENFKPEYGRMGSFSDDTYGSLFQVVSNVMGKDLDTAEDEIGEFFDTRLTAEGGFTITDERAGICTEMHIYIQMLEKEDIRFNGMEIWTDVNDGSVRRVSFELTNTEYSAVYIADTPEFQEEIRTLFENLNNALASSVGDYFDKGYLVYDEDSPYYAYELTEDCLVFVGLRDFTEEGGNGLVNTELIFADCVELLD